MFASHIFASLPLDAETAHAIEQARQRPAMGATIHRVCPQRPYVSFWLGMNGRKVYVGKRVFGNGHIQGYATCDVFEAVGFASADEALAGVAALGYTGAWMMAAPYAGQLRLL